MKKKHFAGLAIGALMVALVAFMLPTTQAAETTMGANVTVWKGITITTNGALSFAVLSAPTDMTAVWVIDPSTGALSETGGSNSQDIYAGDHSTGDASVTGEPNETVYYTAAVTTDFGDANLTLTNATMNHASEVLDGSGNGGFSVGATLDILTSITTTGLHNDAVITVTANY